MRDKKRGILYLLFVCCSVHSYAQVKTHQDSSISNQILMDSLKVVTISAYKSMNGVGRMKSVKNQVIYAGKKTEVVLVDSLDANKAINNTRQIIGRIPGLNIAETESDGFTANGIGFRGLNPYQSIETNTRQNGYNISADVYGYNEAYYLPPMEAVKNIVFLRGASSLAFGPQIGGMIDYELKDGGPRPIQVTASQTIGSHGMYNSFNSIGGTYKKIKYYGFLQYRYFKGWRDNSQQNQLSGFASLKYNPSKKLQIGVEYTMLRNTIRMPGGLTDSLFDVNPSQSLRSRNWLQSPWNILEANATYKINNHTSLSLKSAFNHSERDLVWRNEDGWPVKDTITPTLSYAPREIEHEYFRSITNELRFITGYQLANQDQRLSLGVRYAYNYKHNLHGADGTTGSDLDYTTTSPWGGDMNYYNTNLAIYAENMFKIGDKLLVTPGIRYEYLSTTSNGYDENTEEDSSDPFVYANNQRRTRTFVVSGVSVQLNVSKTTNLYADYSQSYQPITYDQLTPFGSIAKIDPHMKDPRADNVDIGYRGTLRHVLNFDISGFYINYRDKIGVVNLTNDTTSYAYRTNTGDAEHEGIETYVELNITGGLIPSSMIGRLSVYNSFAYINAHYVSGNYAGNEVEYAPKYIERVGLNYRLKNFSVNMQYSYTSSSFGDASNKVYSPDALVGIIPVYSLVDISGSYRINKKCKFKFGINNLTDKKYFTLRTSEYPGPGIIPAIGRMFYVGLSASF